MIKSKKEDFIEKISPETLAQIQTIIAEILNIFDKKQISFEQENDFALKVIIPQYGQKEYENATTTIKTTLSTSSVINQAGCITVGHTGTLMKTYYLQIGGITCQDSLRAILSSMQETYDSSKLQPRQNHDLCILFQNKLASIGCVRVTADPDKSREREGECVLKLHFKTAEKAAKYAKKNRAINQDNLVILGCGKIQYILQHTFKLSEKESIQKYEALRDSVVPQELNTEVQSIKDALETVTVDPSSAETSSDESYVDSAPAPASAVIAEPIASQPTAILPDKIPMQPAPVPTTDLTESQGQSATQHILYPQLDGIIAYRDLLPPNIAALTKHFSLLAAPKSASNQGTDSNNTTQQSCDSGGKHRS